MYSSVAVCIECVHAQVPKTVYGDMMYCTQVHCVLKLTETSNIEALERAPPGKFHLSGLGGIACLV